MSFFDRRFEVSFALAALLALSSCRLGDLSNGLMKCDGGFDGEEKGAEMAVRSTTLGSGAIAQSFKLRSQTSMKSVILRLNAVAPAGKKVGGMMNLSLQTDNGNTPDGVPIATASIAASQVTVGTSKLYNFDFNASPLIVANQRYWLVLDATYSVLPDYYVTWSGSNSASLLVDGNALYQDGNAWSYSKVGNKRDLIFMFNCQQ